MVYIDVAAYYSTSSACVERNIRTLIDIIWKRGNRDYLAEIAGCKLEKKPTNKEFINILEHHYKNQISK